MNADPVKQAWQASVEIAGPLPLEDVRRGADRFYRFVKWRNAAEYVACVIVVGAFGYYVFSMPHVLQKTGSALTVIAALYAVWQLHRRASAEAPESAGTIPISVFQRRQLARHRDALRGIFWWYMLPFIPGLLLIMAGSAIVRASEEPGASALGWPGLLFAGIFATVFYVIWKFNQRVADKLQRHIDEIDALTKDAE